MSRLRRALELIVTTIFRSRVGIAVGLAVAILGVVAVARVVAGPDTADDGTPRGAPTRPLVTIDPGTGDDGVVSPGPVPSIVVQPGTAAPDAVAREFAGSWVDHRGVSPTDWHAALLPHCTTALAEKLAEVDPAVVPADRVTGEPALIPRSEALAEVTIPVDSGQLRLRLVSIEGRWLVDGVDWERP